jgi:hypothetical protein
MRRAALGLVLVSLMATGCNAAIPASVPPQPLGSGDQAGGSLDAEASSTVEVSPSPMTVEELAALYSKADATADKADRKAYAIWLESSRSLDAARARSRRDARATLTFLRTVREMPWPADLEPIAQRLIKCNNTVYDYQKKGSDGKGYKALSGLAAVKKYDRLAGRMGAKCSVVAHKLRLELGLDPPFEGDPGFEGNCGSLLWIDGYLVADNGRVILAESQGGRSGTPLTWPDGWTVRPLDGGQLEIMDAAGTVQARTGEGIVFTARSGMGGPLYRDGALEVCPPPWPDNYMDPNYVPPTSDTGDAP